MAMIILRLSGVLAALGVKKSALYQWIKDGKFPAPVRLGPRAVGWQQADVDEWVASRESTRNDGSGAA